MRRFRKPDRYDEEGNPYSVFRPVRFPRLNRLHAWWFMSRGFQLRLPLHLLGWVVCGGLAALINPWLIPIGILVFEVVILVLSLLAGRRVEHLDTYGRDSRDLDES